METKRQYRKYVVTVTPTVRIAGQSNQPEELEFSSLSGSDAIKQARTYMADTVGHDTKTAGPLKYKSRLAADVKDPR